MSSRQLIMFLLSCSCWILVSNSISTSKKPQGGYGDPVTLTPPPAGCENCRLCQYPCNPQPQQPPPAPQLPGPGGSDIYLAPPPPPQMTGGSDLFAAPPPPPAPRSSGVNCPPVAPVICCQNSPPMPYSYPNTRNYTDISHFSSTPPSLMLMLLPFVFLFHV